jgi:hypothetical protein
MNRTRILSLLVVGLLLTAPACSSDSSDGGADAEDPTSQVTEPGDDAPSVDPASVQVFTSQEVCDLVSEADMGAAVAGEVTNVVARDLSTPQCSYDFTTATGERANLSTSVQRPEEDLGGSAGAAGFDVATSVVIFDTPYEPLDDVGDQAAISASENFTQIVVLAGDQVLTIGGNVPVTEEQVKAAAAMMVAGLA